MKSSTLFKSVVGVAGLFLILSFQNCAKTNFSPDGGDASLKSMGDVMPPDLVSDMPEQADTLPEDEALPEAEETTEQDVANGVRCIGNGIKVPDSSVVACADGKPKCVQLCIEGKSSVATFHAARSLVSRGAVPGACP